MEYTVARDVSQCTYRCVVLPDTTTFGASWRGSLSQCTYRCVVLPDLAGAPWWALTGTCLNAPTGAWCSLTDIRESRVACILRLNAPTGAWCSLTPTANCLTHVASVSMHLQVRGAP